MDSLYFLHNLVEDGDNESLKKLLTITEDEEIFIDVNQRDCFNCTPLHVSLFSRLVLVFDVKMVIFTSFHL